MQQDIHAIRAFGSSSPLTLVKHMVLLRLEDKTGLDTPERTFACNTCGKGFARRYISPLPYLISPSFSDKNIAIFSNATPIFIVPANSLLHPPDTPCDAEQRALV